MLVVKQAAIGNKILGWPSNVYWPINSTPVQTAASNYVDTYTLVRILDDAAGNTMFVGTFSQKYSFNFPT